MAKKYIACRDLIVNGKKVASGKQVVGVKARNLKALISVRHVRVVDDEDIDDKKNKSNKGKEDKENA